MLLFASYHYSERTRVMDWWRKTPDKSFLSTSVIVAFLLSYSLTLRQLRSYSLTWGSCSYSVTSNNRKRLLKIAQCEPGLRDTNGLQASSQKPFQEKMDWFRKFKWKFSRKELSQSSVSRAIAFSSSLLLKQRNIRIVSIFIFCKTIDTATLALCLLLPIVY